MSYDLNFYKRAANSISKTEIEEYLIRMPNVTNENRTQWFYQNEETGVYCTFEYAEDAMDDEDIEKVYYEGFDDTNFSFSINFIRPQFFGKECFPLADKFASDLNLLIINPQGDGEPKKYPKGLLESEWAESNLRFAKSNFKEFGLGYLELDKSNYSWEFCFNRNSLQQELGGEYFVPRIFYIRNSKKNSIETLCVWPEHIPIVLPKVDYIVIQRKIKKLFRTKKEDGLITYSDLDSRLGNYFSVTNNYKVLHPNESAKIARLFSELPLIGNLHEIGEGVAVDAFVNVIDV